MMTTTSEKKTGKRRLLLLFGPSGAGKTTLGHYIKTHGIPELVSHTTRPKRDGEIEGLHYYYVSHEEMDRLDLAEKATYPSSSGVHTYGLSKPEIERRFKESDVVFAVVERDGLRQMKEAYPDEVETVYILIPEAEMEKRLVDRGDDPENVRVRLERARTNGEFDMYDIADHVVLNTDLDAAKDAILGIAKVYA